MKTVLTKITKALLLCIISTIIIYLVFTIPTFYIWCTENQMFVDVNQLLVELDSEKIQKLGDDIGNFAQLMEDELQRIQNETNEEEEHTLAEYYNPLGYSVWAHFQLEINDIINRYIIISILSGVAIAIAYIVITTKKMNYKLKIAIGYFGVMLIIPPIYMYSWTYRFWDIFTTYSRMPIYFYIGYTILFIVMYLINYRVGAKMAEELNEAIKRD